MIVCQQCFGKKSTYGTESTVDANLNTESMKMSGPQPAAVPCSQCNGTGIQNSFGA